MLDAILLKSDLFVNDIQQKLSLSQYHFFEKQLVITKQSLKLAKQNLILFQNKYQMFSPEHEGESVTSIMDTLQGELSKEKAFLKELLGSQKHTAPLVVGSKERIRALSEQIVDEKKRLSGEGDADLNDLVAQFTDLELEFELGKQAYASALAALEQSRAEISKKMKHMVVISQPSLAEDAKYPEREYIILTVLLVLLMLYGIVRMVITTIREHQD